MIFVTVGTSSFNFARLIEEMDYIAGKIDEEVIIQIGYNVYEPKNTNYFRFRSNEEIEMLYERARIIVSHAGVGCILTALKHNKPNIVVPRRKKYGEHFDDHQVDIAEELENEKIIKVVWDVKDLEEHIMNINTSFQPYKSNNCLTTSLKGYLNNYNQKLGCEMLSEIVFTTTYIKFIKKIENVICQCRFLKVLNIGSGGLPIKGAVNLDKVAIEGVDLVGDLGDGLPFKDNSFDLIIAFNVLEHLTVEEFENMLREMKRVSKQNAMIKIQVPFFASEAAFSTIDHRLFFAYNTFWRYRRGDWYPSTEKLFDNVKVRLIWHFDRYLSPLNFLISKIVNAHYLIAMGYQNFFCWILPMKAIDVVLIVEKDHL